MFLDFLEQKLVSVSSVSVQSLFSGQMQPAACHGFHFKVYLNFLCFFFPLQNVIELISIEVFST